MFGTDMVYTRWLLKDYNHDNLEKGDESFLHGSFPENSTSKTIKRSKYWIPVLLITFVALLVLAFGAHEVYKQKIVEADLSFISPQCHLTAFRREWRSLSHDERRSYISSVRCLQEKPSRLGLNGSLHDDFSFVHFRVGGYCRYSFET